MNSKKLYILSFVKEGRPYKGAVNSKGEVIIPPNFKQIDYTSDQTELIPAGIPKPNAEHAMDLDWGYINQIGEWKIKPQFDKLTNFYNEWAFAKSKKGQKWGKIDKTGAWIENPTYQEIGLFSDGLVWAKKDTGQYVFLDETGKIKFTLDGFDQLSLSFSEKFLGFEKQGKWGFIDTNGAVVLEPKWEYVGHFSKGLAPVYKASAWQYIDTTGQAKLPEPLEEAMEFDISGYAAAKKGRWGVIDMLGNWTIKPQSQVLLAPENNVITTKLKGEWCTLNMQGEVIEKIPVTKKMEGITPFDENDVAVAFYGDYAQLLNRQYDVIFDSKKYKAK
ncbi:WG repeat-containing protein [Leptospira borgpetersenii serovar Hardjo-bovis]|uniref:WG repeat-containing protein n=3 Tax=Leptospira borgpetersenii TaxID=174 RepID=M6BR08_LEPBO|nr:WG repeat-containing protein [Leptospira borgpetersenii]ABJ78159.1 Conserved hypothetical protein [Leptospira borgpetersenii serovar Hardjo-bovis str. L550]AMX57358.1 hypothetical protein LBK6_02885 [Leptospira borgpetersenii serovar Hardjo]AMX60589.1 hypothetical protein LBK9_02830 [Leptospira borgpetersenii serovar Hardjo]AMX63835.1 hypothetical protein LBK30_02885 [Leptospira borgpetersenii serovar Hardjo]AMX67075.1 hypothetical protein LBHA_02845 [Leptospira borgpetersenii serovar Hardj